MNPLWSGYATALFSFPVKHRQTRKFWMHNCHFGLVTLDFPLISDLRCIATYLTVILVPIIGHYDKYFLFKGHMSEKWQFKKNNNITNMCSSLFPLQVFKFAITG